DACSDRIPNCNYDRYTCNSNDRVQENCKKSCGICETTQDRAEDRLVRTGNTPIPAQGTKKTNTNDIRTTTSPPTDSGMPHWVVYTLVGVFLLVILILVILN
ncbi:unnamed protein product, partial [Meganyctiphanes norvegica]